MSPPQPADTELLARARRGDEGALNELRTRHLAAARRFAALHGRAMEGEPDDLVDDAFAQLRAGTEATQDPAPPFRVHLFITLRRLAAHDRPPSPDDGGAVDEPGAVGDVEDVEDVGEADEPEARGRPPAGVPAGLWGQASSTRLDPGEQTLVLTAYESLPERWQVLLWQIAVEGLQLRELAPSFGLSANAASALAYRGREKLRQAYVEAHLRVAPRPECAPHRARLVAYVRDGLGRRDQAATETHIGTCPVCRSLVGELRDIDRMLVRAVLPAFLPSSDAS